MLRILEAIIMIVILRRFLYLLITTKQKMQLLMKIVLYRKVI